MSDPDRCVVSRPAWRLGERAARVIVLGAMVSADLLLDVTSHLPTDRRLLAALSGLVSAALTLVVVLAVMLVVSGRTAGSAERFRDDCTALEGRPHELGTAVVCLRDDVLVGRFDG